MGIYPNPPGEGDYMTGLFFLGGGGVFIYATQKTFDLEEISMCNSIL